jgi:citrate lyase subunit beta/citryl-CoA lyase
MTQANVEPPIHWSSLLFVPGGDVRKIERAVESGADAVILDLEDSVAAERKSVARHIVCEAIAAKRFRGLDVVVRINPPGTEHHAADVDAVAAAGTRTIMLPKSDDADAVATLSRRLDANLLLLVETPLGVLNALDLARVSKRVRALSFGPADFSLAMGLGEADASRGILYHARCQLVLAAKAADVAAFDSVHLDVKNESAFRDDTRAGLRLGYDGKLCIHPRQVAITNEVYRPTAAEMDRASRILEEWERGTAQGRGVFSLEGQMLDAPVVAAQRRLLDRARRRRS